MVKINYFIIVIGLFYVLYFIICQFTSIYFYWESITIGIILVAFGALLHLLFNWKASSNLAKFSTAFFVYIISIKLIIFNAMINSRSYEIVKKTLIEDANIQSAVGTIVKVYAIPFGSMSSKDEYNNYHESSKFHFIIQGDKSYKYTVVNLIKEKNKNWEIVEVIAQ